MRQRLYSMTDIEIVPTDHAITGPCSCCNLMSHNVRGEARVNGNLRAVYYVRWMPERLDGHAEWTLDMGNGRDVPIAERSIVALLCRSHRRWPAFMVIDAARTSRGTEVFRCGQALAAADVVGRPIATEAYAIVDQVLAHDPRVTELFHAMAAAEPSRWRRWLMDRRNRRRPAHRSADAAISI